MVPAPALPARSETPVLARAITLLALLVFVPGVKVAVQVMPASALLRLLRLPWLAVRSARVKPVTASLKVMVTSDVSPA